MLALHLPHALQAWQQGSQSGSSSSSRHHSRLLTNWNVLRCAALHSRVCCMPCRRMQACQQGSTSHLCFCISDIIRFFQLVLWLLHALQAWQ
jgi:hypothetical protein